MQDNFFGWLQSLFRSLVATVRLQEVSHFNQSQKLELIAKSLFIHEEFALVRQTRYQKKKQTVVQVEEHAKRK